MDKKLLTEQDIRTKFITPALQAAGWDLHRQLREEVTLTEGRIQVRSNNMYRRDEKTICRADYVLYHQPNVPLAVVEAKDNKHALGAGMQQALQYAKLQEGQHRHYQPATNQRGFFPQLRAGNSANRGTTRCRAPDTGSSATGRTY